jgi:hypothetical protein
MESTRLANGCCYKLLIVFVLGGGDVGVGCGAQGKCCICRCACDVLQIDDLAGRSIAGAAVSRNLWQNAGRLS